MTSPTVRPDFTTSTFWINTGERVVRTGAQAALALGVTDATTALSVSWPQAGLTVGLAMLAALLTGLAGKAVGDAGSPSFLLPAPRKPSGLEQLEQDTDPAPAVTPLPYDRDARTGRGEL